MADRITRGLVISRLVRLANSANGNPRYEVIFTDGTSARTAPDAMISHGITNSEYQGVPLVVTFDRAGRITQARPAGGNQ